MSNSVFTSAIFILVQPKIWDYTVGFVCLALNLSLMAKLIALAGYHFDVTDDSYYILAALYPKEIVFSAVWFETYTGLLWSLTSDSLAGFRQAGMISLVVANTMLSLALSMWIRSLKPNLSLWMSSAIILSGLLFGNVVYYQLFLLTPSYNWLTLFGMIWAVAGVFFHLARFNTVIAASFLGLGGFLTFAGKPVSGLALLVLVIVLFATISQLRRSLSMLAIAIGIAGFLCLAHMMIVDGGFAISIDKLITGKDAVAVLTPGRSLMVAVSELSGFFAHFPALALRIFPITLLTATILIAALIIPLGRVQSLRVLLARGAFFALVAAWVWDVWTFGHFRQPYSMHVLLTLPLSALCVFTGLVWNAQIHRNPPGDTKPSSLWPLVAPIIFLLICPFLYSFGTNNRIAYHTMSAAGFTASAILTLGILGRIYARQMLATALVCVALSIWAIEALKAAQLKPYRSGIPIAQMEEILELPAPIGRLTVTPTMAAYATQLRDTAYAAGFVPQTPLIDLTGGSPGAAVLLGARFVGVPWMLGGYPGSESFVNFAFDRTLPATLEAAWILRAPEGARAMSPKVLMRKGLDFPKSYRLVGTIKGGPRGEDQELWIPLIAKKRN